MTIEEYLQSLTGQRLTLEQLRALSQGGLLSGGDFMGRTVGDVVGGRPRRRRSGTATSTPSAGMPRSRTCGCP